ncbi:GNAT family N-acyltransferase [Phaeobacter sp.]|uniref:GNAT family N-acetyltransferase n=1 Tax=Phaeobacter sp. TaxID=1902409 RepID=UPI0025FBAC11|nr:GNAT family N-acyltransferase [Phaeobacter sp.]
MGGQSPDFEVKLAHDAADLRAAQALRYRVFVQELGGQGDMVDHEAGLERDRFDPFCDHLLLLDKSRAPATSDAEKAEPGKANAGQVVGVYRVMTSQQAEAAGGFYCAGEYDLAPLLGSGRTLLELGRSCVHPDYRGGTALYHLWSALAAHVERHDIEVLFGVASFHGTDIAKLAQPLSMLQHNHLAPAHLRPKSRAYQPMDLIAKDQLDRRAATLETPALIKAYLRVGGCIGDGAFVDHAFNTTDVCLILDIARMNERHRKLYTSGRVRS